ncbi:MAG: hypothetical protein V3U87_16040 [Methylococcaceae bacterium]
MKNELTITIIACAVVFSGVSLLAFDTINQQMITPVKDDRGPIIFSDNDILKTEKYTVAYLSEHPQITRTSLGDGTTQIKTLMGMTIPKDNTLPWAFVEGTVANAAPGHPVIVQIFKSLDDVPIHVAQVDLDEANSFSYKFRVYSLIDGVANHLYEGDYFVKTFKVVITPRQI